MSNWHVGMKVVCVDAESKIGFPTLLTHGAIYTIIATTIGCCKPVWIDVGVREANITYCTSCGKPSAGSWYNPSRFRPIDLLSAALDRIEEDHIVEPEPQHA